MDNPSRQIVVLSKKIVDALHGLRATLLAVQQHVKSIAEQNQARNQRDETFPVLRSELQIPQPIEANRERQNTKKVRREWYAITVSLLTLVAVLAYAIINYHMLGQMRKANEDARAFYAAEQRAWIVIFATHFGYRTDAPRVTGTVVIENTGPSPALKIHVWRCGQVRTEEPSVDSFPSNIPDCIKEDVGEIGKGIPLTFNMPDESQVVGKNSLTFSTHGAGRHYFAWGRIEYDIYPPDKRHFTSFCLIGGTPGNAMAPCNKGNDAD